MSSELDEAIANALALNGRSPRVLTRLDEAVRRAARAGDESRHAPKRFARLRSVFGSPVQPVREVGETPVAVALASLDADGRRREAAVRAIIERPVPELTPFLVLRCDDWAERVRGVARDGLAALLAARPEEHLRPAMPIARHLAHRIRGAHAADLVFAAGRAAPAGLRAAMAGSAEPAERLFAFEVSTPSTSELLRLAVHEWHPVVRGRAAKRVYSVGGQDAGMMRELAGSRYAGTRALGLTGLAGLGLDAEVAERGLSDPGPMVRPIGRAAARRLGIDPVTHYRSVISPARTSAGGVVGGAISPAVIAGLAETGDASDAPVLVALLGHGDGRVRAAAVRALAALEEIDPERVVPLLHDPSPSVVREASIALRGHSRGMPDDLPARLLADPRSEVRRAGRRLLRAGSRRE